MSDDANAQLSVEDVDNDSKSSLEQRLAKVEKQLQASQDEVLLLKSAMANLMRRVEAVESRPAAAAGTPAKRTGTRPQTASTRSPANNQYETGTLPRNFKKGSGSSASTTPARTTPGRDRATSKDDTDVGKNTKNKKPSPAARRKPAATKSPHLSKIFQPLTEKNEEEEKDDSIDPKRKGFYNMGGKKIHFVLPEKYTTDDAKAEEPSADLVLYHTYGFNGAAARDNLFVNHANKDEIIYSLAGTGVVHNTSTNQQRFFTGHNEDILCLAVHPNRPLVATGQLDPKGVGTPYICIWDSETMQEVKRITHHDRGVINVSFSPDGKYLLSLGNDDNHTMAIWDWENVKAPPAPKKTGKGPVAPAQWEPLLSQNSSKDVIFTASFSPKGGEESKTPGEYTFVTVGVKHLTLWTLSNIGSKDKKERQCKAKKITTQTLTKIVQKAFHSVAFLDDQGEKWVVGTQSGHVYRMEGSECVGFFQAHDGIVGAVCSAADDTFVTMGDDGLLKTWGEDGKEQNTINVSEKTGFAGKLSSRAIDYADGKVLLGFKSNSIAQVSLDTGDATMLTDGHNKEVWALAIHPTEPVFVTGAHDNTVKLWNYETCTAIADKNTSLTMPSKVRSAHFSPSGEYLALGQIDGTVTVLRWADLEQVWSKTLAKEQVDAVCFSPDSSVLGAGSWDQMLYLVNTEDGKVVHTMKGHTSSILMLNFSVDGKFVMTNSRDYEILYWDAVTGKRIRKTSSMADVEWSAWNCFLGWPVQGIWEGASDGTDINAVDRSPNGELLAAGDDFGIVRLFKYPCMTEKAPFKEHTGHSSHVANVRFTPDNQYLMSCGGGDTAVFQWKVTA